MSLTFFNHVYMEYCMAVTTQQLYVDELQYETQKPE